ncbi:MAG: beta-propeller fold lactonase family protein [Planctomycetota bacterium]|nr:beta-propeller fold lactonase family protein [Planctomycetota bacterium]
MRYPTILCLALLAGLLLAVPAASAADPLLPNLTREVKEEGDLKLDWAWQPLAHGNLFFISIHRSGTLNSFRRDPKTGEITFLKAINVAEELGKARRHIDLNYVVSEKNILYVAGAWTHAHGDGDGIGLRWYQVDEKDGSFKLLGTIPTVAGHTLVRSAQPNTLYLLSGFSKTLQTIAIDPSTGAASVSAKVTGKGIDSGLAASPDGRFWYSAGKEGVAVLAADKTGALSLASTAALPEVPENSHYWRAIVSPDGKHLYVAMRCNYGKPGVQGQGVLYARDASTGALTLVEKIEIPQLGGISGFAFTADGKTLYYCGGPEAPAAGLGYFVRDPASGKLTHGGKAQGASPVNGFAYAPDSGTIYAGGFWSTKSFKLFSVPAEAAK